MKPIDFFLLEAVPGTKKDIIYLFGKTLVEDRFVNTCVQVTNLQREIYVMPKEGRSASEVETELRSLVMNHPKDKKIPIEFEIVKRKYCFELNVDYRN